MNNFVLEHTCQQQVKIAMNNYLATFYKFAAPWSAQTAKTVSRLFAKKRAPAAAEKNYHSMIKGHLGIDEPTWFAVPREKKTRNMLAAGGYSGAHSDEAVKAYKDMGFNLKKDQVVGPPGGGDAERAFRRLGLTEEKFTPQQNTMLRSTIEGHELDELRGARANKAFLPFGHRNVGVVMREGNRMRRLEQTGGNDPVTRTMKGVREIEGSAQAIEAATGGRVGYMSGPRPSRHAIRRISQMVDKQSPLK